jgi:hypothetical protein
MSRDAHYRDSKIMEKEPLGEPGSPWTHQQYLEMDARFRSAMLDALERGDEHMPTARRQIERSGCAVGAPMHPGARWNHRPQSSVLARENRSRAVVTGQPRRGTRERLTRG